ncbi:MAG: LptF/LptG family permease [Bacteroidales bacterium]|nr:LptF/LptG family permease [Bacteroidales bacterium]
MKLLTRIDIYIIKKFLGTYFFSILLIISIAVVFDINENLDKFMDHDAPVKKIIFDYYLNFIPYFSNLFSPLFTFIAVIFFTSKLADNSEIIAMLSSGISLQRLIRPYLISASIIAITNLTISSFVIPPANVKRINFQNSYIKNKKIEYAHNIQLFVDSGVVAHFDSYDNQSKRGSSFSMERFEGKSLKSRLTASSIQYDTLNHWTVKDYIIRNLYGKREELKRGASLDTLINIEPADFLISVGDQEQMTSPQLKKHIEKQKDRGFANVKDFEIEYYRRFAMAFASFILTTIGISISSRKIKGGMGMNIGIGLGLSFGYILFMTISSSFAVSGLTSAAVAVWIPNIIFSILALYLYTKAPR